MTERGQTMNEKQEAALRLLRAKLQAVGAIETETMNELPDCGLTVTFSVAPTDPVFGKFLPKVRYFMIDSEGKTKEVSHTEDLA